MTYAFNQEDRIRVAQELVDVAKNFANKGWFPATAGNLSIKLSGEPLVFGVTASGKDKENLTIHDILAVDGDSKAIEPTNLKPSAETLIHAEVYKRVPEAGACLHVHTLYNNLISDLLFEQGKLRIQGLELIKALNIWEENAAIEIPIVENFADIPKLAAEIGEVLDPRVPAVLIRNHGIYAWGADVFAAKRHVQAFEWMFHYMFLKLSVQRDALAGLAL
ncbi:methylthioribulose 1-phosphate dehydratase [Tumebacillus sp. ITR2]|uniref:Methylthioribulose-1-phosphate dehydratase n=1 Tax=Tumebacillus amylolyticus TaxID=2801339 RepID=A0ABS1J8P8_9BACL|nr:methylthioribulose 1-phosphate dehydratase [Tumebacillus amylolyticus]